MTTLRKLRLAVLLLVLGCTVGCDQTSKHFARTELSRIDSVALPGGFGELRLAENPGAFLSLGDSLPQPVRVLCFTFGVGAGLLALLFHLLASTKLRWLPFVALAMVIAGGASNLIDRITRQGSVTDFITLRVGPFQTGVFNVADTLVMLGVGLLVLAQWKCALRQPIKELKTSSGPSPDDDLH
jgi:signal peptidase II